MSRRRKNNGRKINGILILDKPVGLTSNAALQRVKRLFGAAKAGHTGSLDPLASGVLPICFGEATKFSQFLLDADKGYQVTIKLGVRTDSSDAEGEIVSIRSTRHVTEEQIRTQLKTFEGEIDQIPSMFSAIKHNGQPLYKLARQGIETWKVLILEGSPKVVVHDYLEFGNSLPLNPNALRVIIFFILG